MTSSCQLLAAALFPLPIAHSFFLPTHFLDDFTEELLQQHDEEIARLKCYYETHQELFEAIHKWEKNWRLFQELEVAMLGRLASQPAWGGNGHTCC